MGSRHMFACASIISKTKANANNPFPAIVYSSAAGGFPSLFLQRCCNGKASKDKEEEEDGGEKGSERAPSTAEEFERVADEKLKETEAAAEGGGGSVSDEEALGKSRLPNDDLDRGPGYRPCS